MARKFRTPSRTGGLPGQFGWLIGGDSGESGTYTPHIAFQKAELMGINGFIHVGDIVYADQSQADMPTAVTVGDFRMRYKMQFGSLEWALPMSQWINLFIWDGHEIKANYNISNPPASLFAAQQAYREYVSCAVLNRGPVNAGFTEEDTHYYHVDLADLRIIVMDTRRFRSQSGPDRMGEQQLAWVKDLLSNNEKSTIWLISANPMSRAAGSVDGHLRAWFPNYTAQRDEIWNTFSKNNDFTQAKLMIFSGDIHALSWGRPDHPDPNIVIECVSAPLAQGYSSSGMYWHEAEYFAGTYPPGGFQQLGTLVLVDEMRHEIVLYAFDFMTETLLYTHVFHRPGDVNGDGCVDVSDLLILLSNWGPCPKSETCEADFNSDGTVDVSDLLILLANWG